MKILKNDNYLTVCDSLWKQKIKKQLPDGKFPVADSKVNDFRDGRDDPRKKVKKI